MAAYLVRRRVRITALVFIALVLEDMLIGVKPHDATNLHDPESVFGIVMVFCGLGLRSWAAGILRKTEQLTMTGPYAIMRHPLYVGSFLIMIGFCALIDDVENIFFVLGPFVLLYMYQVRHEERVLSQRYGARWYEYQSTTPRFVPRRLPRAPFADWRLAAWLGNREWKAVVSVLAGMVGLQIWRLS